MFNRTGIIQSSRRIRIAGIIAIAVVAAACGSSEASGEAAAPTTTTPPTTSPPTTTSPPSTTTTTTTAPAPLEPTEIVDAYYAAWTEGEVDQAMAHASSDFTSSVGNGPTTANYMAYVAAVGQQVTVTDCSSTRNGLSDVVTCKVEQSDALVEALALLPPRVKHTVTDGTLDEIKFSETYGEADYYLGSFARAADPTGYQTACAAGASESVLGGNEVEYTGDCGAFLAGFAGDAAADIIEQTEAAEQVDPVALVQAFYDAWDDGDMEAAATFLSPRVTSPAGTQSGTGLVRLINYMEYVKAIPQSVQAGDCDSLGSLVTCHVEFRDALINALGIEGSSATHEIRLGLISHVALGAQYAESDAAVAGFLRDNGGADFETACAVPDDGSAKGELGLAFTGTCGAFVAQHIDDAAEGS